jgi:hypothetical protein
MNGEPTFTRVVLGVSHTPLNPSALRFAADFADMLDIELLGLFVKDTAMLALPGLPFIRELNTLENKWSQIDPARLSEDVDLAARQAHRRLRAAVRVPRPRLTFETLEGDVVSALAAIVHKGDIVILPEPRRAQALLAQTIERQAEAAFLAQASVLLVPDMRVPQQGPVAAIARHSHQSGVAAAVMIAVAAKASLLVVDIGEDQIRASAVAELAGSKRISVRVVRAGPSCVEAGVMPVSDLGPKERLLVVTRGAREETVATEAGLKRAVPVLIAHSE